MGQKLGLDESLHDDLIQETLIRVCRKYRPDGMSLTNFVHLVGRGKVFDLMRRHGRKGLRSVGISKELAHVAEKLAIQPGAQVQPGPATIYRRRLEDEALSEEIERLPENVREALRMHLSGGLTQKEVGKRLGISTRAAKGLCERARRRLYDGMGIRMGTGVFDEEKLMQLRRAVTALDRYPIYHDAFVLTHVKRLAVVEVVARLREKENSPRISEQTLKVRLERAYGLLLRDLGQEEWNRLRGMLGI